MMASLPRFRITANAVLPSPLRAMSSMAPGSAGCTLIVSEGLSMSATVLVRESTAAVTIECVRSRVGAVTVMPVTNTSFWASSSCTTEEDWLEIRTRFLIPLPLGVLVEEYDDPQPETPAARHTDAATHRIPPRHILRSMKDRMKVIILFGNYNRAVQVTAPG